MNRILLAFTMSLAILLLCLIHSPTAAQEGTGETRFLDAGDLLDSITDWGGPFAGGYEFGRPFALFPQDHIRASHLGRGKLFGFCQKDFVDTAGVHHDFHSEKWARPPGTIGQFIEKTVRFEKPTILVDNEDISATSDADLVDENITADIIIHNRFNNPYGIEVDQTWYQWSDPQYDNFYIVDIKFKFTGDMDGDGTSEYPYDELTQVYFTPNYCLAAGVGYEPYSDGGKPYWKNYHNNDPGYPFHAWTAFLCDDFRTADKMEEGYLNETYGIFEAPNYSGYACLYADMSETERIDDGSQPTAALTFLYEERPPVWSDVTEWVTALTTPGRYAAATGDFMTIDEYEQQVGSFNWAMAYNTWVLMSFGPYNLKKGDEPIRVVLVYGVDGEPWYDWDKSEQIAQQYLNNDIDATAVKSYLRQGETRLLDSFVKAKAIFDHNFQLPNGINPVPPSQVSVEPASGSNRLSWSAVNDVINYKVYRSGGPQERPVWEVLNTVDANSTSYIDTNVKLGFNYYYAVTAVDAAGGESGINYTKTIRKEVIPFPQTGKSVDAVRVVPNPFYLDPLGEKNYTGEPDRIQFMGLPGACTIRILTLSGTLVAKLENTDDRSGSIEWDQVTLHNQRIKSGVYIYHIEDKNNNTAMGKFIVVR